MSFRLRLTLLASLAVAVALVGAAFAVYYTDRSEMIGQFDSELVATEKLKPLASVLTPVPGGFAIARGEFVASKGAGQARGVTVAGGPQPNGAVLSAISRLLPPSAHWVVIPHSATALQVRVLAKRSLVLKNYLLKSTAQGVVVKSTPLRFKTALVHGVKTRLLSFDVAGVPVQISGSLEDVDRNLGHLRFLLLVICLGGIGAAALLGGVVSHTAVAPLRRLTRTTERIVETGDLSERTGQRGRDEVSRLSTRLDELLATLESSLETQRRLVADASHELRTPLATLRANVELLAEPGRLDAGERAEIAADVREELEAMTMLVGELVELARGEEPDVVPSEFRLDELVATVVERVARRTPELTFATRLEPTLMRGVPERIERALANLLDNARKWSPSGGTVDVEVAGGVVCVRDRGPGIDAEDLPLVFNRFYRSARARGMPGAGLGLAIVKQIADAHAGSVEIAAADGGGTIVRLVLPATSTTLEGETTSSFSEGG